ncbi:energy transducer TonB [Lishizhenia tianjinensis]|uniref:energy transducer TonB n=1 Tax=Lishizhenia tianjinensis TaxID=477690 RepID=UPI0037C1A497
MYPDSAKIDRAEGKVYFRFIVERDGSISEVHFMKSSGKKYLDAIAFRVKESMYIWIQVINTS